jgi:membrane associated rhomboid family serine protease
MADEKNKILKSLIPPFVFLVLIWVIKLGEIFTHTNLVFLGVYPHKISGLMGIITSPLIHSDIKHLSANSVPLFVLGGMLMLFYRNIAFRVFAIIYILSGISVWVGAREAYHIGASGVVYGLAGFLFFSGIFRREKTQMVITLLVTFLYGSMVWGIFPDFYPEENISYESHFWGLTIGSILAFYYRKQGPTRKKYQWEIDEELEKQEAIRKEMERRAVDVVYEIKEEQ